MPDGLRRLRGWQASGSVAIGSIVARMGGKPLEVCHHLNHGIGINGRIVPTYPISSLPQHPSDLPIHHATDEFLPWGLIGAAVLNTCLGSVVEELIVADPKGSVPGLVICPTVVGVAGHRGEVVWFFLILQATPHRIRQGVDTCSTVLTFPLLLIRCDRLQDAQQFITIAGTIEQGRCNFKSHELVLDSVV